MLLMSCETIQDPIEINGCCAIFDNKKPSRDDTQETIGWMIEHNKVYDAMCKGQRFIETQIEKGSKG